jgi:hypothetical protein
MRYQLPALCWCLGVVVSIAQPAMGQISPSLSTVATTISTTLPLDGEGSASTHIIKVADVAISTDNSTGLTLRVTSGSLPKLNGPDIPFQVTTVRSGDIAPSSGHFTDASGHTHTYGRYTDGSENRDVYILYTPNALQDPGIYRTSIQVSVVNNP